MTPKTIEVGLDLGVVSLKGTWEPSDAERRAGWELYVELITRVSVVPLEYGRLRESLTSFYSLFGTARTILRAAGPVVARPKSDGQYSFGFLTVALLNFGLRPMLGYWHPELAAWEHTRPTGVSPVDHERVWSREGELRDAVEVTRKVTLEYAALLGAASGVPDLRGAVP